MIPKAKIEAVLQEADIVKIIGDQIPLEKKGRNYFAVCPFHDDKNPSMAISREKRIYKCFSCGAQGNAIKFLENFSHLTFLEALKIIASTTPIDLESDFANLNQSLEKFSPQKKLLFEINEVALQYFKVTFASRFGKTASQYLEQRNLTSKEIEKWELGYSHSELSLHEFLMDKGYKIEQLKEASLITIKDGKIQNYFNNRLMFPIRDLEGNLIGFSGRNLTTTKNVKYLNVRETPVFRKSQLLFNINHALRAITRTRTIIIVEGFMDVFSLSRIGFEQTVATMGTNFSDFHVNTLKKLNPTVTLFFDGDRAGVEANIKAIYKLSSRGLKVKVVDNPTRFDPDELIKNGQESLVTDLIENALDPWDYAINKLQTIYNITQYDQLKIFLKEIFKLIKVNNDPIMVNQVLKRLAQITNLDLDVLKQSYYQTNMPPQPNPHQKPSIATGSPKANVDPFREILGALAQSPKHINLIKSNWELIYKTIDERDINFILALKTILERYLVNSYKANSWEELQRIFEQVEFDYQSSNWQLTPQWLSMISPDKNLTPAFLALEERYWKQKERYYLEKIEKTNDPVTLNNYWLQQKESREKLLDLRKKRTEWQWKK